MKVSKSAKAVALGLSAMLAVSALAGCGQKKAAVDTSTSTLTLNGDKIYPIQTDDTLTYWTGTSTNWSGQYENFGDTPLGKKISENTGVKVEYLHPQTGQEKEQFNIMITSGELPDIVQNDWTSYSGGPEKAIEEGYIHDLSEIIPKWSPAFAKLLKEHPDWDKQVKSDSGKYYSYGFIRGEDILTVGSGLCVRKDWLDKAGLAMPETIDEWETALKAFKANGATKAIASASSKIPFMGAYGLAQQYYLDGNTVKFAPYEDAYKDFLTTFSKWYSEGLIDPDIATADAKALDAGILNGQVGATYAWAGSGIGKWLNAKDTTNGIDPKFDLVAAPTPVLVKGQKPEFGIKDMAVLMGGCCVAITQNCKNVELAARFLDYGYTEEGEILFNFGIEGESFNWQEKDGKQYPTYTDLILHNPDGLSVANALGAYTRACYSGLMVQRIEYVEQYYQYQQQKDALKIWSDNNMKDHVMPSVTISADHGDDYSDKMATITTYVDEMYLKFLTGAEPISNFDAYKAQLEAYGVKDVIKYKQEAYDRYLKR